MTTLMPNEEYRELLKKKLESQYLSGGIITFLSGIILALGYYFIFFDEDVLAIDESIFVFIAAGMFPIITIIQLYLAIKVHKDIVPHYSYNRFVDYDTIGLKVPITRVVSDGESSSTIYMIMELTEEEIILIDVYKRRIKEYLRFKKEDVRFRFQYKTVDDIPRIKSKLDLIQSGKKKKTVLYGLIPINELLIEYLRSNQYHIESNL